MFRLLGSLPGRVKRLFMIFGEILISKSCPKYMKFRIWTRFKVPEINLRSFLRLGSLLGVSRAFSGFQGLFPEPDTRICWNSVRIQNVRFLRWIWGASKNWALVWEFQGFLRISGIISRTWHQNGLLLSTNTKCEVSEINLRFFLELGSSPGVSRAFSWFQEIFQEPDTRIGWNSVRIQNVRFLRWI